MTARNGKQGMNWIRKEKRLAIYVRDGLACVYCGEGIEDGVQLTLDHIIPNIHGGSNDATNLVTACRVCNSSRSTRSVEVFAKAVAEYLDHGLKGEDIAAHVHFLSQQPIDVKAAKELIARRGGWASTING